MAHVAKRFSTITASSAEDVGWYDGGKKIKGYKE